MSEDETAVRKRKSDEQVEEDKSSVSCHRNSRLTTYTTMLLGLLIAVITAPLIGCNQAPVKQQYGIASPTLSPDNNLIIFALGEVPGISDIAIYDIAAKKLLRINPTGKDCLAPVYSPDGRQIAFASGKGDDKNIYIMNADGTGLRQLTHIINNNPLTAPKEPVVKINGQPTFSRDGKRLVFGRSGVRRARSMGGTMVSHWDFYEVDIASGVERKLTDYRYYMTTRAYYLPSGDGIVYSGSGPKGAEIPEGMYTRNGNEIMLKYERSEHARRAFEHPTYSADPTVALDGSIAFVSRTNLYDNTKGSFTYDIFLHKDGQTRRVTKERFAIIASPFISYDGSRIVF